MTSYPRSRVLNFRLTELEYLEVKRSAEAQGSRCVSDFARRSLLKNSREAAVANRLELMFRDLQNRISVLDSQMYRIRAIHLGVPCEDGYDEPGPANSPFTLVTPAGLIPRKGHAYALRAARILLDRGFTSFRWQFLGRGPLQADLMAIAARHGLAGHCEFPGYVENDILLDRYRRREVDCLVLPSISLPPSEGIPHSLMQAMSFATPVIATRCGSIPELVTDGAGLLVPERDAESLADAVLMLARNDGMRRRLGARARQVVLAGFSEKQTGRDLLQAFQESSRSPIAIRGGSVG